MPHVLTLDAVDDVVADMLAAITDALQRASGPQHLEHLRYGARIFHHVGHQLTNDGLILPINLVIIMVELDGRLNIHARKRIQRIVQLSSETSGG